MKSFFLIYYKYYKMSSNIGGSTLSHRIHNEERSEFDSSNKEFMDNQEDACMTRKEEKDCPENYTGKLITHYEKYEEIKNGITEQESEYRTANPEAEDMSGFEFNETLVEVKKYTTVTRVDNGCGMDDQIFI